MLKREYGTNKGDTSEIRNQQKKMTTNDSVRQVRRSYIVNALFMEVIISLQ